MLEYDESLIVPYPERSLRDGAIDPWTKPRYDNKRRALAEFAKREGHLDGRAVAAAARAAQQQACCSEARRATRACFPSSSDSRRSGTSSTSASSCGSTRRRRTAPTCRGTKLQAGSAAVRVGGRDDRRGRATAGRRAAASGSTTLAALAVRAADRRARFCARRATASRSCATSGSATSRSTARRARSRAARRSASRSRTRSARSSWTRSTCSTSRPSACTRATWTGCSRLLHRLRDAGNTVLVVEHDLDAIAAADYMVELGPGSGEQGGELVFAGPMSRVRESPLTGAVPHRRARRSRCPPSAAALGPRWLTLTGAREHNLQGVDVQHPARRPHRRHRRVGLRQEHARARRAATARSRRSSHGEHSAKQHLGETVGAYDDAHRLRGARRRRAGRPEPDRQLAALEPGHLREGVRRDPRASSPTRRSRGSADTRRAPSASTSRAAAARPARARATLEVEMVFMADVFVPCETAAASASSPRCST